MHRIGILDVRILNTDRHAGNLLVRKLDGVGRFGQVELIPIDHGLCLPESLEDPYFEWIHWPQASIPFSDDELEYIEKLDPNKDSEMLRAELPMIREACLRVLALCTIFLKEAAACGLCLAEIGEMMTREFRGGEEEPSELEVVCIEGIRLITDREILSPKFQWHEDEFQFDIDCEDVGYDFSPKMVSEDYMAGAPFNFGFGGVISRSPLSKLDESIEEEDESDLEEEDKDFIGVPAPGKNSTVSKLSVSLKNTSFGEKSQKFPKFSCTKPEYGYLTNSSSVYLGNSSSGHRSASEQLPVSVSFVKLSDMNEEEWHLFLEKFPELLSPAFAKRKSVTLGQRQRQRLGTSCQF